MSNAREPSASRPRPLSRAQRLENEAFLAELRRTGNAREAARRLGAHRAKFTRRRAKHPAFAAEWDAALAFADARIAEGGDKARPHLARPHLVRRANGRLQVRAAPAGSLDAAARTRFLLALAACANVRLAAKAADFSHAAFYHHKRRDPDFAREWRGALETGYARLEAALIAGFAPGGGAPDDWLRNDLPPIAPMTPGQAIQLLYLHQKEARLWETPSPLRCLPGEPVEARDIRLMLIHEAKMQRERERCDQFEAARRVAMEGPPGPHEPPPPVLPDLAQVTGWSKASGKPAHDPDRALFGGWRLRESPE